MKQLAVLTLLLIAGLLAWLFGSRLSADALGMAVGLIFGVLAGVPAALLVLAANRRPSRDDDDDGGEEDAVRGRFGPPAANPYGYQPPVIVVTSPQPAQPHWPGPQTVDSVGYPVRQALPGPGPASGRAFKVVGEKEEWLDEW